MPTSTLKGNWTYRSFINDPAPVGSDPQKALALIFGEGQLRFTSSDDQIFKAVLDFGGGISSGFDEALNLWNCSPAIRSPRVSSKSRSIIRVRQWLARCRRRKNARSSGNK